MDLLYQRYASPFSFINGMIQTGRFYDFVVSLWNKAQSERTEEKNWQYFLHKVFDGSYNDFKEKMRNDTENMNLSAQDIETTMNHTMDILKNFNPEKGGDE